jgi:low temperature requirement protein LtrA
MKNILWHFGKVLQMIALLAAPYSLYVGLTTENSKIELQMLLGSATLFLLGLLLVKSTSSQSG